MENDVQQRDSVDNPSHYSLFDGKYEVIDLIEDRLKSLKRSTYVPRNPVVYSDYANVLKYACRWHHKNGIQDLKKMIEYAEMIVDQYEHEEAMDILEDEIAEDIRKAFEFEKDASFDRVSAEYYDTLYGFRAERGPF